MVSSVITFVINLVTDIIARKYAIPIDSSITHPIAIINNSNGTSSILIAFIMLDLKP